MEGIRVSVHDKDREFVGQIGAPLDLKVIPRVFPLIGSASMAVALSHKYAAALRTPGARVVFETAGGEHLLSGPVDEATVDTETGNLSVTVIDDTWVLAQILGWQVPGTGITGQGSAEYKTYTGPAESIIKAAVRENGVNRLKVPGLKVAPDLGRGKVVGGGVSFRMHPLPDRLFPGVEMAGIGVQVRQVGTDLVCDVYEPRRYPVTLSVKGRTLTKATWSRRRPQMSRIVIGGPGEGVERRYRQLLDAAREAEYGFCGEGFQDARDAKDDSEPENTAATAATMDARGMETLASSGPLDGISITLAESSTFIYSTKGVLVGDIVDVEVEGTIISDVLKEAVIEAVTPNYSRATPTIGEQTDPATRQAKTLAALKESQRKEERA